MWAISLALVHIVKVEKDDRVEMVESDRVDEGEGEWRSRMTFCGWATLILKIHMFVTPPMAYFVNKFRFKRTDYTNSVSK